MRFTLAGALLLIDATYVSAFPAIAVEHAARLIKDPNSPLHQEQKRIFGFNPKLQYVSTTGDHKFVPPNFAAGDQRGPCPGLNAAANHGYIPHNGVGNIADFIKGTNDAFGMALDLGAFLAVYGAVMDGNLLSWSIGGPTPKVALPLNNVLGLTGTPRGISGSHNKYETDTSPTRGDLFITGDDFRLQVPQFQQYYDSLVEGLPSSEQYNRLLNFRVARHEDSVNRNPNFFYAPFAGVLVSPAGFSFPVRMMANHSAEFPDGSLSRADLMKFFAIEGKSGNFIYKEGHERIPDNWYKRAIGNEFTIAAFLVDVINHGTKYPPLLNIGGNTGKTNSFAGVDLGDLTGGVFNSANLLQGNNLACFLLQAAMTETPDVAVGLLGSLTNILKPLTDVVSPLLKNLSCPKLQKIDRNQFNKYPGYTRCPNGCSGGN